MPAAAPGDPIALTGWEPMAPGNATLALTQAPATLQLDYDFKDGKGFVVARRPWARPLPQEFALHLRVRGRGAVNDVEIKLVDPSGANVWRHVAKSRRPSSRWKRWSIESCDFQFAWGPASGSVLTHLGFVEVAVVAEEGGRGSWWIGALGIEDLSPAERPIWTASSAQPGFEPACAAAGSGWKPRPGDRRPWLAVDTHRVHRIGGVVIDWLGAAPASGFRISVSRGGRRWRSARRVARAGGTRSSVYLPDLKTRYVRLELAEPSDGAVIELQPFEFSRSIEAFWYAVAAAQPRGSYPRWLYREQSEWTPIGRANGTQCALLSQDGMLEPTQGSCSLEPMVRAAGRLFTWAEVAAEQGLRDGWTPVPWVRWRTEEWTLTIGAEGLTDGAVRVRYMLENCAARPLEACLFIVLRPFQVTPPWQSFRDLGGPGKIYDLSADGGAVRVNSTLEIQAPPDARFGAMSSDEGSIAAVLGAGRLPDCARAHDELGFASGAFEVRMNLAAGEAAERTLRCGAAGVAGSGARPGEIFDWHAHLGIHRWSGNGWAEEALEAQLTATAHILVTRSGPALQPGPRRYTRSWIRDGAMMGAALLRMGRSTEVLEYIRWYAAHQRADGFVPCCVDGQGVDWLVEHDSHGQLIALIGDYWRFTTQDGVLHDLWPHVEAAVTCIERLLQADGLLPASVSHEGYLAQPVHSFWDDFWALRGLKDAAQLARALGRTAARERCEALEARLSAGLVAAIEATRAAAKLDYVPASVEWADFDPTATANAIYLLDLPPGLDRAALDRTFDRYLEDWRAKRQGRAAWQNYTPYEIRIIGALVRLARRDDALELLRFFLADRRPAAWNQWPEIAWRDRRAPAHLGDLPHTWIAAEYVLAVRSLFAYERAGALVLAGGLAREWIESAGVRVRAMPTAFGSLSYELRRIDARTVRWRIEGGIDCPLCLRPPLGAGRFEITINGERSHADGEEVTLERSPAEVIYTRCIGP